MHNTIPAAVILINQTFDGLLREAYRDGKTRSEAMGLIQDQMRSLKSEVDEASAAAITKATEWFPDGA
jgi:hypothetical protein